METCSELCGQAMIAYLQQKGFPEVALHFAKDERTRFNLALGSENIQIVVASAKEIDEKDHWYRLGVEALRQGNSGIVEFAYQRAKNFERLSFLYLVTGNLDKLSKMLKIAEMKNDVMGQFHNVLYLGDIAERVKILENAGHLPLAYDTAKIHGLQDIVERLEGELGDNVPILPEGKSPTPIICGGDWPLLRVMGGIFDNGSIINIPEDEEDEYVETPDWIENLDPDDVDKIQNGENAVLEDGEPHEENEGGRDLEDLELPPELDTSKIANNALSSVFVAPTPGVPVSQIWSHKSSLAAEHALAGNFDIAMQLL